MSRHALKNQYQPCHRKFKLTFDLNVCTKCHSNPSNSYWDISVWTILVHGRTNRWTLQSLQPNNNALVISAVIWRWTMKINKITTKSIIFQVSVNIFFTFIYNLHKKDKHNKQTCCSITQFLEVYEIKVKLCHRSPPRWAEPWTLKKSNEQQPVNGW